MRRRLDAEMVRRALCASRTEAQEAIRAGLVTVDGAPALKPATQVTAAQALVVAAAARKYVSRGGEKLAHGLDAFGVSPQGRTCLDAGVSTGGFTDCLLQRGAAHVFAVDVGYGQVHESLRTHPQVTVRERTNVRDLRPADLPTDLLGGAPDLLVADLSFISLAVVLPSLLPLSAPGGEAVVLVKPQFEAARTDVGKGGVVRDPAVWEHCLHRVADAAPPLGWRLVGATASSLLGPAGNVEFLVHLIDVRTCGQLVDTTAGPHLDDTTPGPHLDDTTPGPHLDDTTAGPDLDDIVGTAVGEGMARRSDARSGVPR